MFSSQVSPRFLPHSPFQTPNTYFKKNLENIAGELGVSWLTLCSEPREQESQGNRGGPRAPTSDHSQEKNPVSGTQGSPDWTVQSQKQRPQPAALGGNFIWNVYFLLVIIHLKCSVGDFDNMHSFPRRRSEGWRGDISLILPWQGWETHGYLGWKQAPGVRLTDKVGL